MNTKKLKSILRAHAEWLKDHSKGRRADLSGANLICADLRGTDLRNANISYADLRNAGISYAHLMGINLMGANIRGANIREANISDADLRSADLCGADLRGADLRNANISWANIRGTYLNYADMRGANLIGSDLRGANLRGTILKDALLPDYSILPEGDLIGYKKLANNVICKLLIPAKARRVNALGSRKCRAEYAKVLKGKGDSKSPFDEVIHYKPGKIVRCVEPFNDDIREECASGIHFFITQKEAKEF